MVLNQTKFNDFIGKRVRFALRTVPQDFSFWAKSATPNI
jgi:hypothetical protein